jgi:D-alanyl-lipoteichoic acid acyltransferase DltB (MBOAT superfamily)
VLFNSYIFLFLYLPFTLTLFFLLGRYNRSLAGLFLFTSSLFFYGWWNPAFLGLLVGSIAFNYGIGVAIGKELSSAKNNSANRLKWILWFGIIFDLSLLGYYKYANFFVDNLNLVTHSNWQVDKILLPLGVSFFTFTQIAFLVDTYRGKVKETNFIHYGLFVTYFPHLIAGPVLHHSEMMPQFAKPAIYKINWENFSVGLSIFAIGFFKKVVIADGVSPFASPVFNAAADGTALSFIEAWGGALAYTFQLYFDFSGYSDMAIGLSRLFGVKLPLNFDSPYKSKSIIEFWRRWHMTLSRFLRDYLYFALGGNRKGTARRYLNLFATMLLGGLWHGAGWTFVIWGGLHGLYLSINHAWLYLLTTLGYADKKPNSIWQFFSMLLTFFVVILGWVFFRAPDVKTALDIISGMLGLHGFIFPNGLLPQNLALILEQHGITCGRLAVFSSVEGGTTAMILWIAVLWASVWLLPNTQEILGRYEPALDTHSTGKLQWQPKLAWLIIISVMLIYTLIEMGKVSEFLYFQF